MTRVTLRIEFGPDCAIGPGKVRLLELVGELGSISAAGRSMGMSYRRAWLLIDSLNRSFKLPAVSTQLGGQGGGGAFLTDFGKQVVGQYRAMENEAANVLSPRLRTLERELADNPAPLPQAAASEIEDS